MKIISDYIGRAQCDSIKGIFILFVFVSHFMSYVAKAGSSPINLYIGQLMVAPFLFYSGYGVMESIKNKGRSYLCKMPKRRMLTTLINFDIAVLAFVILNLFIGYDMSLKQISLSLVCWESIGNSNWYIFVIILCYAVACVSGLCIKKGISILVFCLLVVCMFCFSFVRPTWWYDTMLCFAVGMAYSEYKSFFENICKRFYWVLLFLSCLGTGVLMYRCPSLYGLGWNVKATAFSASIVLITMLIPIRFTPLEWCGRHLFPLYIYQRIPMILLFALDPVGFTNWRMPIYFLFSLLVSVFVAFYYQRWQIKLQ